MTTQFRNYISIVSDVKPCKMYDLEVGKEYFINRIIDSKYGYKCITDSNVIFYANRSLNDYIKNNKIQKFYLKINTMKDINIDGKDFKYPLYDVAIVRCVPEPEILITEDYESILA